jgi:hypothetical protein
MSLISSKSPQTHAHPPRILDKRRSRPWVERCRATKPFASTAVLPSTRTVFAPKRMQNNAARSPKDCAASRPCDGTNNPSVPPAALLDSPATSRIQASTDQRARRLDSVQSTAAAELRAPSLLAPGHLPVRIGCSAYACAGRRTSREQCAEDYCRKQSAFCFHHGIPFFVKNAIGNSGVPLSTGLFRFS